MPWEGCTNPRQLTVANSASVAKSSGLLHGTKRWQFTKHDSTPILTHPPVLVSTWRPLPALHLRCAGWNEAYVTLLYLRETVARWILWVTKKMGHVYQSHHESISISMFLSCFYQALSSSWWICCEEHLVQQLEEIFTFYSSLQKEAAHQIPLALACTCRKTMKPIAHQPSSCWFLMAWPPKPLWYTACDRHCPRHITLFQLRTDTVCQTFQ